MSGMNRQRGAVLALSVMLVALLGLLGLLALQASTQQTRMVGNLLASLQALETAESLLRAGEARLPGAAPEPCGFCLPPFDVTTPGAALPWQHQGSGRYLIQNLGRTERARGMADGLPVTLFRVTAVAEERQARVVLESVVALPLPPNDGPARRIAWREISRES
ncbi:hypothetical protein [Pseudomonas sp. zfem002]|uniref:pilus assembly PilX family protein n=1 Tax=Pseudomonas sp. zfem002 TaxID=3078197 RepID=UPI0029284FFC|nr:hypothetical protein [Pseudomonas sp. zfem002]MDU9390460.1 hypothetical protein [Pseudomonas sp. zfem002]